MSENIIKNNAQILYDIIDSNIPYFLNFENLENPEPPFNIDYSFNYELLDSYKENNLCLSSCFDLIKDLFSVKYIDRETTITILKENCVKIKQIIDRENSIPIVLIDNCEFSKSNFFFTLYFLYLYRQAYEPIQFVSIGIINNRYKKIENALFNIRYSGMSANYAFDNLHKPSNFLGIICDDFMYSGSQMEDFIIDKRTQEFAKVKISLPRNFKLFINCIGCTQFALNRITRKIDNFEEKFIMSDEIYNKQILNIKDIILEKYPESGEFDTVENFLKYLCWKHDVFILKKKETGEIIVSSMLYNFIKNYFLEANLDRITMIYLFFKYPDYASTMQNLCGINLLNTELDYYVIPNFGNRVVNDYGGIVPLSTSFMPLLTPLTTTPHVYIEHYQKYNKEKIPFDNINGEINIEKIFTEEEINLLVDNLGNHLKEIEINGLKFQKCENTYTGPKQSLIKNCDLPEDPAILECDKCIMPFYKTIKWLNPFGDADNYFIITEGSIGTRDTSEMQLDEIIFSLNHWKETQKKSKYLKYKNKYLQLKKKLAKK
jgi:hypothetical protein